MRKRRPSLLRPLPFRKFRRDETGATAVEFALVAVPFFALLFAILEIALIFFAQQVMDTGVSQAARLIRTGQAQGFEATSFKTAVCDRILALFDCDGGLRLEVRTYPDFASIDVTPPVDDDGNLRNDFAFQPGNGGDIVVVRAFYEWPTIVPGLGADMANLANGKRLLASTVAFRNEPFGS